MNILLSVCLWILKKIIFLMLIVFNESFEEKNDWRTLVKWNYKKLYSRRLFDKRSSKEETLIKFWRGTPAWKIYKGILIKHKPSRKNEGIAGTWYFGWVSKTDGLELKLINASVIYMEFSKKIMDINLILTDSINKRS